MFANVIANSIRSLFPPIHPGRQRVLEFVTKRGFYKGATDDEIERALRMRHQTASARRRELVKDGLIMASGRKRPTRSGRFATIWVATNS